MILFADDVVIYEGKEKCKGIGDFITRTFELSDEMVY